MRSVVKLANESGIDSETAAKLVQIAHRTRNLKGHGLDEGISTRLLVYAGQMIGEGVDPSGVDQAVGHAGGGPVVEGGEHDAGHPVLFGERRQTGDTREVDRLGGGGAGHDLPPQPVLDLELVRDQHDEHRDFAGRERIITGLRA